MPAIRIGRSMRWRRRLGGESFDAMIARVGAGLERLVASAKGEHTVIISHGGAIRAACAYALGLTAHQALCLAVDNISLTRLERNDHGWRVLSINEHLSISAYETTELGLNCAYTERT